MPERVWPCRIATDCEQFANKFLPNTVTYRHRAATKNTEEPTRITYLDYLDTVEVISSILVAPIFHPS